MDPLGESRGAESDMASSLSDTLASGITQDGLSQNISTALLAKGVTKNSGAFRTGAKTCVLMPKPPVGQNCLFE